jgi:hypothetical protein
MKGQHVETYAMSISILTRSGREIELAILIRAEQTYIELTLPYVYQNVMHVVRSIPVDPKERLPRERLTRIIILVDRKPGTSMLDKQVQQPDLGPR